MIRKAIGASILAAICATALSQTADKDKKLIEKYPAADRDKDGKLSEQELLDLKKSVREKGGVAVPDGKTPPTAPAVRPTKEQKANKRLAKLRVPITFADVAYGPLERNHLDFWKTDSQGPAPVLVLIHGGGFTGGDKSFWYSHPLLSHCHENGISVAAINYRLIKTDRYPAPMHDGARAVQFLRSQATEWNIDPTRIAAAGGSAGACIAVWLGLHDDLVDSSNPDPIVQQSTRLSFVVSYDGQTSLDPDAIVKINPRARTHPWFHMLFGASAPADFDLPAVRKLIDDATAINSVSKDDPPIYMNYQADLTPIPLPPGEQNMHHPYFGVMLKEKMDSLGLESVLHYQGKPPEPDEDFKFILKHFGLEMVGE